MSACCNKLYNDKFDRKKAEEDLEDYRKNGVKPSTRPLLSILNELELRDRTLLDIGGGIGALIFELMPRGLKKVQYVEISEAYRQIFQEECRQKALLDRTHLITGDFLKHQAIIQSSDLVTLDKVICCYPDYHRLVTTSLRKATKWYAYVIPVDSWWFRCLHYVEEIRDRLKGDRFKFYIHPPHRIEALVKAEGFTKIAQRKEREWLIAVFER